MIAEIRCLTCHHQARWQLGAGGPEPIEITQPGGSRQPSVAPELASWRVWARSLRGELGPVVGRCPHCAQPVVTTETQAPWSDPWVLPTPLGEVTVGADQLLLHRSAADLDSLDGRLEEAMAPRLTVGSVFNIPNLFGMVFLTILGVLAALWIMAAMFLVRFYIAMGVQDNVSIPLPPP